ncbi:uncharacterized protein CANTADRAFT_90001 [Suhomyces tanzawaensis NRRL Y-17324]|uniref:RING-type E3 ubiquitin transferase n=1 Tax=Suhomyces tanzawaensis NRRL Y-17324 TaxID=984487 RepID=A0A1E4SHA0_9ASCO|nr:uncharacterized protein CANTADRAFT_90001 [Suhomyces tanzawaensis NRRL Y-17324]ODV78883.1 hypothetical protein CANTADRAFT_90001 [Suhomyces tanzawaensis NRRL Y-17324]
MFRQELYTSQTELQNSNYSSGYGNVTGFHLSYQDMKQGLNATEWPFHEYNATHPWKEQQQWSLLPDIVSERVMSFWGTDSVDHKAYLLNISGNAYGQFEQENNLVQPYHLQFPGYLADYFSVKSSQKYEEDKERYENDPENNPPPEKIDFDKIGFQREGNITGNGELAVSIKSHKYETGLEESTAIDNAVIVDLHVNIKDHGEIQNFNFDTQGIYFQDTGSILTTSHSGKFLGKYALPHFAMSETKFELAKTLMLHLLNSTSPFDVSLDHMHQYIFNNYTMCEFIGFFQLEKTSFTKQELRAMDEELANPSGAPLPRHIPEIVIKEYVLYSPDCGRFITNKKDSLLVGLKRETTIKRFGNLFIGLLVITGLQFYVFIKQINRISTPGQYSVISSKTVSILGVQEALLAVILFFNTSNELYLIITCLGVILFVMCAIFKVRFIVSILANQVNERGTSWWEILRGGTRGGQEDGAQTNPAPAQGPPVVPGSLPLANPPQPAPTVEPLNWNEESLFNVTFASGIILTFLSLFVIVSAMEWTVFYRRIFEYVALVACNSYWVPQFLRHTLKNRRLSFGWDFIIGTSVIRLIPVYYLSLYKNNLLRHHYDPYLALVVTVWLVAQISLLYAQSVLGARFWVNEKWLPKAFNYQAILEMKDLESRGFASDLLASIKPEEEHEGILECKTTCPICMTELELPILVDGNNKEARKRINNKEYVITPCHHIFHAECMENWMKYKLQCPVCREGLPPI